MCETRQNDTTYLEKETLDRRLELKKGLVEFEFSALVAFVKFWKISKLFQDTKGKSRGGKRRLKDISIS